MMMVVVMVMVGGRDCIRLWVFLDGVGYFCGFFFLGYGLGMEFGRGNYMYLCSNAIMNEVQSVSDYLSTGVA